MANYVSHRLVLIPPAAQPSGNPTLAVDDAMPMNIIDILLILDRNVQRKRRHFPVTVSSEPAADETGWYRRVYHNIHSSKSNLDNIIYFNIVAVELLFSFDEK